ncbi:MAG: glycosyltransferase family 2 protein [Anaerolineales bacterium]|nr:glycosyltransferase family 2 protein [Anaerolineales bacterium]
MNIPLLSVVIVNWNTQAWLAQCLRSLPSHNTAEEVTVWDTENNGRYTNTTHPLTFEVFVVDNASTDGSREMIKTDFPWVKLIANRENVGFARANNQAIRQSRGQYVLLLNSDTELHPGALQELVRFMAQNPRAGAVGGYLLNSDASLQPSCSPMLTPGREMWRLLFLDHIWQRATYPMTQWDTVNPRRVEVIKGACMLLRHDALNEVGLLDEDYFFYTEEVDLCYRLAQANWQLWYVPTAKITHFGGASSRQAAEAMYLQLYRSKTRFYRKFGGKNYAKRFKLFTAIAYTPRFLLARTAALVSQTWAVPAATYQRLLLELPQM